MANIKGQAQLIQYVITFLISTVIVVAIYFLAITIFNNQIRLEIQDELRQLEIRTLNSIINIYSTGSGYSGSLANNSAILLGEIDLDYPSNVARRSYEMTLISSSQIYSTVNVSENTTLTGDEQFSGSKIIGKTTEDPFIEVTLDLPNIDAVFQGSVSNGLNSILSFFKANINGTIKNIITLGNSTLILSVVSIQ